MIFVPNKGLCVVAFVPKPIKVVKERFVFGMFGIELDTTVDANRFDSLRRFNLTKLCAGKTSGVNKFVHDPVPSNKIRIFCSVVSTAN